MNIAQVSDPSSFASCLRALAADGPYSRHHAPSPLPRVPSIAPLLHTQAALSRHRALCTEVAEDWLRRRRKQAALEGGWARRRGEERGENGRWVDKEGGRKGEC